MSHSESSTGFHIKQNAFMGIIVVSAFLLFTIGAMVLGTVNRNEKATTNSMAAERTKKQKAAVVVPTVLNTSTYCQNPDPSIDKFVAPVPSVTITPTGPVPVDSGSCSYNAPCRTLSYAVRQAVNVSTRHRVFARGGTYSQLENFTNVSGTNNNPIVVCGKYNNEQATFQESSPSPVSGNDGLITIRKPYYVFADFVVRGNGKNQNNSNGHGANGVEINADTAAWTGNQGHHVAVMNNVVSGFWQSGVSVYGGASGTYAIVSNNTIYNNVLQNSNRSSGSGWGEALAVKNAVNVQVINNTVYENYGEGIDLLESTFNASNPALVSGNTVYDNYSAQIYVDSAHNIILEKNFAYSRLNSGYYRDWSGNRLPGIAILLGTEADNTSNVTIRNNVLTNTASNLNFYDGGAGTISNVYVYHNTLYNSTDPNRSNVSVDSFNNNTIEFKDNIVAQPSGNTNGLFSPATNVSYVMSYNNWYGGASGSHPTKTGDVTGNPQLTNPVLAAGTNSVDNYKVLSTSAAVNHGTCITSVPDDLWGIVRPQGTTCDMGAHEFNGSVSPTPINTLTPHPTLPPTSCSADLNRDDLVDIVDFGILRNEMNRACRPDDLYCADISGPNGVPDGIVNNYDSTMLQSQFGQTCN
jgi:hypothetical protein